jgi:soluble lytic murein transglycosylase
MQLLPSTGRWMAQKSGIRWTGKRTLEDPVANIRIGAAYLAYLRERFDSHGRLYLAAYNMGTTNVNRALARDVWPREYPSRVMQRYVRFYRELVAEHREDKTGLVSKD